MKARTILIHRILQGTIVLFLATVWQGCSSDSDGSGTVYTGSASLNTRLHEFVASNPDTKKDVSLTMTGPHELTFRFQDKLSHLDYEDEIIFIRSETDSSEWSAKKVRGGFELEDGTLLEYASCQGWTICLQDKETKQSILKGKYALRGNNVEITLWISDSENHVELLGLMANALFNKSRNADASIDAALETLSSQVWTY